MPGQRAITVTPCGRYSLAAHSLNVLTQAFATPYEPRMRNAATLETLMMPPLPRCVIGPRAA